MLSDTDKFCIECNDRLPISSGNKRLYCDDCSIKIKRRKDLDNKNKKYRKEKIRNTFQDIKVVLIASPYFSGDKLLRPMEIEVRYYDKHE